MKYRIVIVEKNELPDHDWETKIYGKFDYKDLKDVQEDADDLQLILNNRGFKGIRVDIEGAGNAK